MADKNARCYYCDFPIRKIDGRTERVREYLLDTSGWPSSPYERELIQAHPSCYAEHGEV